MKRFLAIAVCTIALLGCKHTQDRVERARVSASATYSCKAVKVLSVLNDGWFVRLDVCGTVRVYEYGTWCEDCSLTWREVKR